MPRTIAAVPLSDEGGTAGVLQVLDKHGSTTFTLRDMTMLGIFAAQAAVAIRGSRVARGSTQLLRAALEGAGDGVVGSAAVDALFASAAAGLDSEDEAPFWRLVDQLSAPREPSDAELELLTDILGVVTRQRTQASTYRRRAR